MHLTCVYEKFFVSLQAKYTHVKRFLYIIAVFVVSLLLVGSMLVAALMSDKVETAAVQLATAEFSRALGTEARVGAIEYRFPARLAIRDVYIEDQQHDTLLYVGTLYAHFRPMPLRQGQICFSHVLLEDAVAKIYRVQRTAHRTQTEEWNYTFIAERFKNRPKKERGPFDSFISVQDVQFSNIRVRYEDFDMLLKQTTMDLNHFSPYGLDAQIRDYQAEVRRRSVKTPPFIVESLKAHVQIDDSTLVFPTLKARLPNSRLDMSGITVRFPDKDTIHLSRSAHEITFALAFHEAQLVPADISTFIPRLKGVKRPLSMTGELGGTLDSLRFHDLVIRYNGKPILQGDVSAVGLPDLGNPFLRANLSDLHTNAAQLQDFLSQFYGRPIRLPGEVHRLGDMHYRGLAEGHLHNLTLHGAFRTALGTITTDGSFKSDSLFQHMTYDARIVGRRFRLGRMLDNPHIGTVTLDYRSRGRIDEGMVHGDVKAHVREFTYNDYTYNDLQLDGHYAPKHYDGHLAIHDPHADLVFDGVVDMQDNNPEMNFNLRCNHFDTDPILEKQSPYNLTTSFALAIDMSGAKPDDISGYIVLDSLAMCTNRDSIYMRQLTLFASAEPSGGKAFTLRSDNLSAQMDGDFRYGDVVPAFQAMLHHYLPTAIPAPKQKWEPVSFSMRADGDRLRDVQRLFVAPVTISDHPTLRAEVTLTPKHEPELDFRFYAPGVRAGKTPLHELTVTLNTITRHDAGAPKGSSGLAFSVSMEAMQMQTVFSTLAFNDSLLSHLTMRQQSQVQELLPEGWQHLTPRQLQRALSADLSHHERHMALLSAQRAGNYGGDLRFITHFSKYNRKPLVDMHFMPGTLILRDSLYSLAESRVTYCAADTSLQIDHFAFEGGGQHIRADGMASGRPTDTLSVDLQRLDASYIVPFFLPVQSVMFNGYLTGKAELTSLFKKPLVETQIHIDSMGLNNCHFGDADVELHLKDGLQFHADVYHSDLYAETGVKKNVVTLDGKALYNAKKEWVLDMQTDSVPLEFVNHWTSAVLYDLDGYATGRVVVGGWHMYTYVLLRAKAEGASLTLPWTGARYTIPGDTIVMDTTAILFPNVHLVDEYNNPLTINGGIYHDMFRDFVLDLHVDAEDALVFDKDRQGEMVRGHVLATGHVDVTGPDKDLLVSADAVTSKKSRFRLSLDNVSSANESNFIHFVEHTDSSSTANAGETDLDNIDLKRTAGVDSTRFMRASRCLLKLNLEVNPQLQFQLVLGERNGDMIQARGSGALRLTYDTNTSDVSLLGTYALDQGTLSYTVANVIRKEFTVGDGSTIIFSGDPTNPQLNVTAKYRVVANLRDLFGDDASQVATTRSNIPVLTCLHMSGTLNNPVLTFSLEFPLTDQAIQQQVRQVINTDEMLMRQVIYLLVFGRFFTPDYMSNAEYATLNSTYSLLSSTVTSQINAWLSKLTNMLTLGVAIRTDQGEGGTSQEYEAQFQLQPVDRLVINGNFGYRYNDISNQPFFGDLEVEVLLTEDGQWRLKGFTHTVDKYSLRQASTIQGVGIMWKKDF